MDFIFDACYDNYMIKSGSLTSSSLNDIKPTLPVLFCLPVGKDKLLGLFVKRRVGAKDFLNP